MKKSLFILFTAVSLALMSCGGGESANQDTKGDSAKADENKINETHFKVEDLVDLDLSGNGIPVIAKAPKGSKVMKEPSNGNIVVYGGKFFKVTYSNMAGNLSDNLDVMYDMVSNTEVNPDFDSFQHQIENGFMKKNKEGKLSFIYGVENGDSNCVIIHEGISYDLSPDHFTDYSNEDIEVMWESAKLAKRKE